jgi:hypothetical protein
MNETELEKVLQLVNSAIEVYRKSTDTHKPVDLGLKSVLNVVRLQVIAELKASKSAVPPGR